MASSSQRRSASGQAAGSVTAVLRGNETMNDVAEATGRPGSGFAGCQGRARAYNHVAKQRRTAVQPMTATLGRYPLVRSTEVFHSLNPATDEVVGTYPVFGEQDVAAAVERAREAALWWAGLGWDGRKRRLLAWKSYLTRYLGRLAELVHTETGKPVADAQLEILLAIVHIDWAARNARRVLRPRRVRSGLVALNHASILEYQPLGVVGVIGPWNYPVFTPMGSIAYALAAGNAVVFKPSELTPAVGAWLVSSLAEVVPEQPVLQLVTGMGEPGP